MGVFSRTAMRLILLVGALLALAAAEPYYGYGYRRGYYGGYGHRGYYGWGKKKRSAVAEPNAAAEPEAAAEPYYGYGYRRGYYGGYGYRGYWGKKKRSAVAEPNAAAEPEPHGYG